MTWRKCTLVRRRANGSSACASPSARLSLGIRFKLDPPKPVSVVKSSDARLAEQPGDPPVVARLIVEIRSDGSRTVARGALDDALNGEKVAVEARGSTPAALAASLIRSLFSGPLLARVLTRRLLK